MTYIPDCRTDDAYNEKYLNKMDKEFVKGFEWGVEAARMFFDNLDIYREELMEDDSFAEAFAKMVSTEGFMDALRECMEHFTEMERDELITSMIDNMDDVEYEMIKASVDEGEE